MRPLLLIVAYLVSAACSSTPGGSQAATGLGTKLTLRDYRSATGPQGAALRLSLVDDSYISSLGVEGVDATHRRASFYSEKRGDVSTKVESDRILEATIQALDQSGFARYAVDGPAPAVSDGSMSLEIVRGDRAQHIIRRRGSNDLERINSMVTCFTIFTEMYNHIEQYQSADPDQMRLQGAPVGRRGRN